MILNDTERDYFMDRLTVYPNDKYVVSDQITVFADDFKFIIPAGYEREIKVRNEIFVPIIMITDFMKENEIIDFSEIDHFYTDIKIEMGA